MQLNARIQVLLKRFRSLAQFLRAGDWQAISNRLYGYHLGWLIPDFLLRKSRTTAVSTMSKSEFKRSAEFQFQTFLFSGETLNLPTSTAPKVSIVLVLYNKDYFTYLCLQSLVTALAVVESEVIIIDNDSKDRSAELLGRVKGAKVFFNKDNRGFILACNQAIPHITGTHTLFLNNDTIVYPGTIAAALRVFAEEERVGAVGGRLILPTGKLQEAGNIIYRDATCKTIARDYPPDHPAVMYRRETDYCSGAFLMTPTSLLKELGGFDEALVPAYYEETDYCIRLRKLGWRIIYEPRVAITHFEFGSAVNVAKSFELMSRNRLKIIDKHGDFLAKQPAPFEGPAPEPRPGRPQKGKKLLYIDDRPPHSHVGAGFPRSREILLTFLEAGYDTTLYATLNAERDWDLAFADLPPTLEIQLRGGYANLRGFLSNRLHEYDVVWISRPHNFAFILAKCKRQLDSFNGHIIYDAEAIFADREVLEKKATGKIVRTLFRSRRYPEYELAKYANIVVSVTRAEGEKLCGTELKKLRVVSHDHHLRTTPADFDERQGIVFLGSLHGHPSPNSDSVLWYLEHVLPLVKRELGDTKLYAVGYNEMVDHKVFRDHAADIKFVGKVDELGPELNKYRLMVIPTRYAAGVPQKAYDAAAYGLPCVCSELIAGQMGWQHGVHCFQAPSDDPATFAKWVVELYRSKEQWTILRQGLHTYLTDAGANGNIKDNIQKLIHEL